MTSKTTKNKYIIMYMYIIQVIIMSSASGNITSKALQ